jgi:CBS domain-containing protein
MRIAIQLIVDFGITELPIHLGAIKPQLILSKRDILNFVGLSFVFAVNGNAFFSDDVPPINRIKTGPSKYLINKLSECYIFSETF